MRTAFLFLAASLLCFGCSAQLGPDSGDPATEAGGGSGSGSFSTTESRDVDKLYASLSAQSDGKTLRVFAAFLGAGFLRVGGADSIVATVDGTSVPMVERTTLDDGQDKLHYIAEISPAPNAPDVVVTFTRAGKSFASKVRLLPNFDIVDAPKAFRVGERVTFKLDPPPVLAKDAQRLLDSVSLGVHASGSCVDQTPGASTYQSSIITDEGNGTYTWDSSALQVAAGSACEVGVDVRVMSWGQIAQGLGSANGIPTVEGLQHRTFRATVRR